MIGDSFELSGSKYCSCGTGDGVLFFVGSWRIESESFVVVVRESNVCDKVNLFVVVFGDNGELGVNVFDC